MGALDFTAELSATRQSETHDSSELKQHAFSIPHAHTVGGGRSGLRFKLASFFLALLILGGIALAPRTALNTAMLMFTGLILTQAFLRLVALALPQSKFDFQPIKTPFARLGPHDWPFYTVLVPLKDEAHMVTGLMATLSKLDYPQERLQIIFITEEDDPKTRRAVTAALRPPFSQVVVPRRGIVGPRTKPNTLNIAMDAARGEIITIYDAEDAPHPAQLKTAVRAFETHPQWGALQAPLDYFNTRDSWLAAQFGLEYAAQFHVWIPLMVRLGLPFPLGGTSNHIRGLM